jgi:type IV fimbrial biogenesis protein FimT
MQTHTPQLNFSRRLSASRGVTLVELMVTLAVVAIVAAAATPGIRDFISNNQLTTGTNEFIASLSFARSEAVRRADRVSIVAVDAAVTDDEWGQGWNIVAMDGTIIRQFGALSGSVRLDGPNGLGTITFDERGLLIAGGAGITIDICDYRTDPSVFHRQINISATGRPQLERYYEDCY